LKLQNSKKKIHSNAPRRLVLAWLKLGRSDRKLAKEIDVNHFYVSQLLWRGIEPGKAEIRVKLFLPAKPINHREQKPEEWIGQKQVMKKIRELHRKTTRSFKNWRNNHDKKST
jgi:hypothetical protein